MEILISFIILVIMLLLSAFFSGSETAFTAASRAHLQKLEDEGDKRAVKVNSLRKNKERLIGAILLGNNLVNICASALATSFLIKYFGEAGVAYATIVMTLLILVFGEILPKSFAIHHAERMSLFIAPFLKPVVKLFAPITNSLQHLIRYILRLFGEDISTEITQSGNEEELRGAIALHEGPDPEIKHERVMLKSVLDLADVEVADVMRHRKDVVMIEADQKDEDIIKAVLESPYTRIPLWKGEDKDNIIGILHVKDLLRVVNKGDASNIDIDSLLSDPWFIPESTSLLSQLKAFQKRHEHFSVVVDEYGSFQGIVTLEDILEEIVGDISDEHDVMLSSHIRPQSDGSYIFDGTVTIRDLNRELDWKLPDEEASTIAGLILHESRQIPEPGQTFSYHGFRFEILKKRKNQITSIKMTPLKKEQSEKKEISE